MNNNISTQKSFTDSFKSVYDNLSTRYSINMHIDFINEFIKFADNTRDIDLQKRFLNIIENCEHRLLNFIKEYENETNNKENID